MVGCEGTSPYLGPRPRGAVLATRRNAMTSNPGSGGEKNHHFALASEREMVVVVVVHHKYSMVSLKKTVNS